MEFIYFFDGDVNTVDPLLSYYLHFDYNPSVIAFNSVVFGGSILDGWNPGSTSNNLETYPIFNRLTLTISGVLSPGTMSFKDTLFATVEFKTLGIGESLVEKKGYGSSGSLVDIDAINFYEPAPAKIKVLGSTPIPEPATMLLLGLGLAGLAGVRRKFYK